MWVRVREDCFVNLNHVEFIELEWVLDNDGNPTDIAWAFYFSNKRSVDSKIFKTKEEAIRWLQETLRKTQKLVIEEVQS